MKWLAFWIIFPCSFCFSLEHIDSKSGLRLEIPDYFHLSDKENYEGHWWYIFTDAKQTELIVEIEEFQTCKLLSEHSERAYANSYEQTEHMEFEGLEFTTFQIKDLDICKCSLRMLAIAEKYREPLYLCDYLFVKDNFGFTISLLKVEDETIVEEMMESILDSIRFEPAAATLSLISTQ